MERSAVATYLGLTFGYLSFGGVLFCAIFDAVFRVTTRTDEVSFLFLIWMFLLIPLGVSGIFLAWLVVLPVEKLLRTYRAKQSVYLATGGAFAASVGFGILRLLFASDEFFYGVTSWSWFVAPMTASIIAGLVTGNQLWKRRPAADSDEFSVTPTPNRA